MAFRIVQRKNISNDTKAVFVYKTFTEYWLTNFLANALNFIAKAVWFIACWTVFLPITLYIFIVTRIRRKVLFSIIYIPIAILALFIAYSAGLFQ